MENKIREKLEGLLIMSSKAPRDAEIAIAAAPMWASYPEDAIHAGRALCSWWFAPKLNDADVLSLKTTSIQYKSLRKLIINDEDMASIFELDDDVVRFRAETGLHPRHPDIQALAHLCFIEIQPPRIPLKRGQ